MRFSSPFIAFLSGLLLLGMLDGQSAQAQSFKPAGDKRHYTAQGKTYYRGPRYVTVGAGISYYNGDLTSRPGDNFINPALTVGLFYRMSPHVILGGEVGFVQLGARGYVFNDEQGNAIPYPSLISFQDQMYTLTGIFRYLLVADRSAYAGGVGGAPKVLPFIQAGIGMALINPQTYSGDALNNGGTLLPSERNDYSALTPTFPVGLGLTFRLSPEVSATLEANYYFTTTNSLDDVDSRGISGNYDSYATAMLKLGYAF